jgi:hypothetical protein
MSFPLFEFAYVSAFDDRLKALASLAQPENWEYRHSKSPETLPVLYNYVQYTFIRLKEQEKIAISTPKDKACFNTGLVTLNYEEIYAYFIPHQNRQPGGPQWYLTKFCRESDRDLLSFGKLPPMARYIENVSDLLYDTELELRKNVDHIIDDNRDRFPEPFRSMKDNFQLRIALEGAIDHSVKRVERNYKTAVPQYYQGHMQLLLPLCMTSQTKADLALAVYRGGNVYLAATCLTLDMAYNNARLIARPDTEWLEP